MLRQINTSLIEIEGSYIEEDSRQAGYNMGDLFNKIASLMNSNAIPVEDKMRIRPSKSEVTRLWCDNTKIKSLTGFKPQYSLDEGLKETIEWFLNKDNLIKYKTNIYNV